MPSGIISGYAVRVNARRTAARVCRQDAHDSDDLGAQT